MTSSSIGGRTQSQKLVANAEDGNLSMSGLEVADTAVAAAAATDQAAANDPILEKRLTLATKATLRHLRLTLPNVVGATLFCPKCAQWMEGCNATSVAAASAAGSAVSHEDIALPPPPLIRSLLDPKSASSLPRSSSAMLSPCLFPSLSLSLKDSTGELRNVSVDNSFLLQSFRQCPRGRAASAFQSSSTSVSNPTGVVLQGAQRVVESTKRSLQRLVAETAKGRPSLLEFGILRVKNGGISTMAEAEASAVAEAGTGDFTFSIVSTEFLA